MAQVFQLTAALQIPKLSEYDITADDLPEIVKKSKDSSSMKGNPIELTPEEMEEAAKSLRSMGPRHVLLKGGHRDADAIDVLLAGESIHQITAERIDTVNTHGTGCSYSAAIATLLAQGLPLISAVASAKLFISEAIRNAYPVGGGHGPINHFAGARAVKSETVKRNNT